MLANHPGAAWRRPLSALALLLLCAVAHAGLGGTFDARGQDQTAAGASSLQTTLAGATCYTLLQANGVTIRQYVNASGTVFGVGWDGPLLPDFRRLLGAHFEAFAQAQRTQSRRISVHRPTLVLDAGGMMRSFSGRAYLPDQLPPTLSSQDIR
jgi:Protein of unknown function (DUF2844)